MTRRPGRARPRPAVETEVVRADRFDYRAVVMAGDEHSARGAPAMRNVRVLVIDDEEPVRRVVHAILSADHCHVDTASDGREALHMLLQKDFDVAVVDLRMRDMGGAAFLREARSIWPWMGVVILSGFLDEESLAVARRHGVTRALPKPVDVALLRDSVMAEARNKRRLLELSASQSLEHMQSQMGVLRKVSEAAFAAESLDAAMKSMSSGLARLLPCSMAGMLQIEGDEQALYLHAVKPVAQAFALAVQNTMLERYEALSGNPRPGQSLRIHTGFVTTDSAPAEVARTFSVPILTDGGVRGLLTLAQSADDAVNPHEDTTFLYHAANHLSTVLSALGTMRRLSVHDALTGVYNRKGLEEEYERAWQQSRRYNFPLGVAIIDIDRFKEINDTHGHQAGDQVLREFSVVTQRVARGTDIVARYGGDEMVVILPQAGPADVIAFGERLLDTVHKHIFCERSLNLQLTASVGVANSAVGSAVETSQGLMARADHGLYRAKKAGRDRVVLQEPDTADTPEAPPASGGDSPFLDPSQRAPSLREIESKGCVLVVDDEPGIALLFARILKKQGYAAVVENSAAAAIERLKREGASFNILLTDLSMPGKSGLELLDEMRSINENLIKIVVTGNATLDNAVLSLRRGAYDFIEKPVVADQLVAVIERAMEYGRLKAENRRYQLHLEDMVREKSAALREALDRIRHSYDFTLEAMVQLLDARERSTSQHSVRVREMAVVFARAMNLSESEIDEISKGALLHDIGKMAIPDSILLKPGKLTEEEREIMKSHAFIGHRILRNSSYLEKPAEIVHAHHERWDGAGYPRGLKGDEIPLGARIFAIVDTYDAMRSNRVYRRSMPPPVVLEEIRRHAGAQFDPGLVAYLGDCLAEFERIGQWANETTIIPGQPVVA